MSSRRHATLQQSIDADDALIGRARKLRRRGDTRKMLVALREACLRDEGAAWLWTLYGALLAERGRADDARAALRHAIWLRHSVGDDRRERSTRALLERIGLPEAA